MPKLVRIFFLNFLLIIPSVKVTVREHRIRCDFNLRKTIINNDFYFFAVFKSIPVIVIRFTEFKTDKRYISGCGRNKAKSDVNIIFIINPVVVVISCIAVSYQSLKLFLIFGIITAVITTFRRRQCFAAVFSHISFNGFIISFDYTIFITVQKNISSAVFNRYGYRIPFGYLLRKFIKSLCCFVEFIDFRLKSFACLPFCFVIFHC